MSAAAGPFVPENAGPNFNRRFGPAAAGAGARPFVPKNARRNNRTRRNGIRNPLVPRAFYVPENAGPMPAVPLPRGPVGIYVPESASPVPPPPRDLITTPGYGRLDLRDIQYVSPNNSKTKTLNDLIQIEGAPRYIVAYILKRGWRNTSGSGYGISTEGDNGRLTVIDNHGQRHNIRSQSFTGMDYKGTVRLAFDNVRYPVPLPDVLIDQIKLVADMQTDTDYLLGLRQVPNWNPIMHINALRSIL
jgi:hypothetical protein